MKNSIEKITLRTIEDNRWYVFQSRSRQRRVILLIYFVLLSLISLYLRQPLFFLAGQAILLLALRVIVSWRKNNEPKL